MNHFAKTFSLSACALAASLMITACGGGATGDTVPPTAVITSAASTTAGNTTYTFTFSEDVGTSFSVEDLLVTGGAASNFTKVNATTYTVDITPIGSATPTLTLPIGKVFDLANNTNAVAFSPAAPALTAPATAAPTPTALAANVISIYSDAYTQTTGVNLNPNWGQSTAVTEVQVASNNTEKYATLNYQGIDFVGHAINVAGMSKLHIDVWTPDVTSIKVSLIATTGGGENAVTITPTLAGWNSFDIDLAGYTVPDKTKIDQIKIEGTPAGGTIYFDNLYFWKPAAVGCGTTEPTCAPTTVIPAGATTIYSETGATAGFDAFPNWGQSTQFSEVTLANNKSLKYSNLNYQGLTFTPIDVSTKGKLHLDVWSAAAGSLNVGIITSAASSGGGALETQVPQALVAGWNSLDIPLTSFTAPNKAKIDQMIFVGSGTIFADNIYFWDTASAGGSGGGSSGGTPNPTAAPGSAGPVTIPSLSAAYLGNFGAVGDAVFAADYVGALDSNNLHAGWATATSSGAASNGNVGYFEDTAISTSVQKIDENGWVAGLIDNPPGVPSIFRYAVLTKPSATFANSYMGLYVNAPNNGTVDVSSYGSIKFRAWGPHEMYELTYSPTLEIKLTGPKVAGCTTTGSGATELKKTFLADQKIGAASTYKISLAGWTVGGLCGADTAGTAVASVLSKLAQVVVTVPGSSFNFTIAGAVATQYATGINLGPIVFTNN
jgi:hypothetical protein